MNRKRCPWCGKIIDKELERINENHLYASKAVPRFLHIANCGYCGRKYGQVAFSPYMNTIGVIAILALILGLIFGWFFFLICLLCGFLSHLAPYSKLDDKGGYCEEPPELLCNITIIEKFYDIRRDELYFLDTSFDNYAPFATVSPVDIYYAPKKSNVVLGKFLYIHEKNYDYIKRDSCDLYDTNMNLVAKIKFQ